MYVKPDYTCNICYAAYYAQKANGNVWWCLVFGRSCCCQTTSFNTLHELKVAPNISQCIEDLALSPPVIQLVSGVDMPEVCRPSSRNSPVWVSWLLDAVNYVIVFAANARFHCSCDWGWNNRIVHSLPPCSHEAAGGCAGAEPTHVRHHLARSR